MDLRLVSDPLSRREKLEVVSVDDVKIQARVSSNFEDSLIADDIEAAYDFLSGPDGWLNGYCFREQTWAYYPGSGLNGSFEVPLRPFGELISFEMIDGVGAPAYVPITSGIFHTRLMDGLASLGLAGASPWPLAPTYYDPTAYRVTFTAGHATPEAVPSPLKKAMKMLCAHWLKQRETIGEEDRKVGEQVRYGLLALAGRYRFSPDHS